MTDPQRRNRAALREQRADRCGPHGDGHRRRHVAVSGDQSVRLFERWLCPAQSLAVPELDPGQTVRRAADVSRASGESPRSGDDAVDDRRVADRCNAGSRGNRTVRAEPGAQGFELHVATDSGWQVHQLRWHPRHDPGVDATPNTASQGPQPGWCSSRSRIRRRPSRFRTTRSTTAWLTARSSTSRSGIVPRAPPLRPTSCARPRPKDGSSSTPLLHRRHTLS